jgi:hypothetical protein
VPVAFGSTSSACNTPANWAGNGSQVHEAPPFVEEKIKPLRAAAITWPFAWGTARTMSASPPKGPVASHEANSFTENEGLANRPMNNAQRAIVATFSFCHGSPDFSTRLSYFQYFWILRNSSHVFRDRILQYN